MRNQTKASARLTIDLDGVGVVKPLKPNPVVETKTDALRKLLLRPNGATVAQTQKCLIWQPHTVRAAISRLRMSGVVIKLDQSGIVARYRAVSTEVGQ